MDFITHGAHGMIIYGIPIKLIFLLLSLMGVTISPWFFVLILVYAFLEGSWPDSGDWLKAKLGLCKRWFWYEKYHRDYKSMKVLGKLPAFRFHVQVVDPVFHRRPDSISEEEWNSGKPHVREWWSRLWHIAVFWWAVTLGGLYTLFFVI